MFKGVIGYFLTVCVVLVVGLYYLDAKPTWLAKVLVSRYALEAVGLGKIYPSKVESKLLISADGGSSLEYLGLKYAFMKNLYFEEVWQWGVNDKYSWLVFQYFAEGRNKWLIVPVRGNLMLQDDVGKSQLIDPKLLEEKLKIGENYSLNLLYKFAEKKSNEEINSELVGKFMSSQQKSIEEVSWEIGKFPSRLFTDESLNEILVKSGDVVLLNETELKVSTISRR